MAIKQQFRVASMTVRGLAIALPCTFASGCASQTPAAEPSGKAATRPQAPPTPRPAYAAADAAYYRARASALATEAMDEVARTDFWRFRRGRLYVPDASNILELEERLADASRSQSAAGVVDASAAILASDQADINAHTLRALALRTTDHLAEADFHRSVAQSLINSIVHAGDGRSSKSAWTAYRVKEEYEVLKSLNARFISQSAITEADRTFDVLDAESVADGTKLRFYFDISELSAETRRAVH